MPGNKTTGKGNNGSSRTPCTLSRASLIPFQQFANCDTRDCDGSLSQTTLRKSARSRAVAFFQFPLCVTFRDHQSCPLRLSSQTFGLTAEAAKISQSPQRKSK